MVNKKEKLEKKFEVNCFRNYQTIFKDSYSILNILNLIANSNEFKKF